MSTVRLFLPDRRGYDEIGRNVRSQYSSKGRPRIGGIFPCHLSGSFCRCGYDETGAQDDHALALPKRTVPLDSKQQEPSAKKTRLQSDEDTGSETVTEARVQSKLRIEVTEFKRQLLVPFQPERDARGECRADKTTCCVSQGFQERVRNFQERVILSVKGAIGSARRGEEGALSCKDCSGSGCARAEGTGCDACPGTQGAG